MNSTENFGPIVFYDGLCALCNSTIKFILRSDKQAVFRFASLQSEAARIYLEPHSIDPSLLPSIILLHEGKVYRHSAAILRILRLLGFPLKILCAAEIFPAVALDALYNFIARNRYRVFGKYQTCPLPPFDKRERFLDHGIE